jgi:hypothetical protein
MSLPTPHGAASADSWTSPAAAWGGLLRYTYLGLLVTKDSQQSSSHFRGQSQLAN